MKATIHADLRDGIIRRKDTLFGEIQKIINHIFHEVARIGMRAYNKEGIIFDESGSVSLGVLKMRSGDMRKSTWH